MCPFAFYSEKMKKAEKQGRNLSQLIADFFFNRYFVFSSKQLSSHSLSLFSTELLNQPLRCHRKLWEEKKKI